MPINFCVLENDEPTRETWEEQPVTIPLYEYMELCEGRAILESKCNAYVLENSRLREDLEQLFEDLQTLCDAFDGLKQEGE